VPSWQRQVHKRARYVIKSRRDGNRRPVSTNGSVKKETRDVSATLSAVLECHHTQVEPANHRVVRIEPGAVLLYRCGTVGYTRRHGCADALWCRSSDVDAGVLRARGARADLHPLLRGQLRSFVRVRISSRRLAIRRGRGHLDIRRHQAMVQIKAISTSAAEYAAPLTLCAFCVLCVQQS
jgi:hypothetical protein